MKKLLILLGFAVLVSSLSGTSQLAFAEKWLASGEITEIFDDEGLLDGVLAVGDTGSQEIEINPAAADSEPADFLGIYRYDNTHVSFGDGVTYGNLPPLDVFDDICFVFNDDGVDAKGTQDSSLQQLSGPTLPSDLVFFSWVIADEDETVYDSDSLPLGETDISEFEFTDMSFFAFPDGNNGIISPPTSSIIIRDLTSPCMKTKLSWLISRRLSEDNGLPISIVDRDVIPLLSSGKAKKDISVNSNSEISVSPNGSESLS